MARRNRKEKTEDTTKERQINDDLFQSNLQVYRALQELIDDCPDVEADGFYTSRNKHSFFDQSEDLNTYEGWRTQLDPAAVAYLKGFRQALLHAQKRLAANGGVTIWGMLHSSCPHKIIERAEEIKNTGYGLGGTSCECELCLKDRAVTQAREDKEVAKAQEESKCICDWDVPHECNLHPHNEE